MKCCGQGTCACVVTAGSRIRVEGDGSMNNPFVIVNEVALEVADSDIFNFTLSGAGTDTDPWVLSGVWATGASLSDIPDVFAATPTTGYVLGWTGTRWEAVPPATATPGSVATDTSIDGDGSGGAPLHVTLSPARLIGSFADGIGLSNEGLNATVRSFPDATARAAATPSPDLNTLSTLDSVPGRVDYWTGTQWKQYEGAVGLDLTGEMLALSGSYASGQVFKMIRQIDVVTDPDGVFEILSTADLATRAGVLSCQFQQTGPFPFIVVVNPDLDRIVGTAYRVDTGEPYASQQITGVADATVY